MKFIAGLITAFVVVVLFGAYLDSNQKHSILPQVNITASPTPWEQAQPANMTTKVVANKAMVAGKVFNTYVIEATDGSWTEVSASVYDRAYRGEKIAMGNAAWQTGPKPVLAEK